MSKNQKLPRPAGQIPEVDEIDLGAALPAPGPPPKRGRGRPRSAPVPQKPKTRKTRKDKGIKKTPKSPYIDNNILINDKIIKVNDIDYNDNRDFKSATRLKDQITEKELKFLEIYLKGGHNIEEAAILAGYEGYSQRHLYRIGQKIVEKYESQVEDHRIILRAMGAGEVEIINGLLKLARKAKSEMVRLNAWSQLSKILGLTKEQLEGAGGLTIVFEGPSEAQPSPGAPPLPPSQGEIKVVQSKKPMMITK